MAKKTLNLLIAGQIYNTNIEDALISQYATGRYSDWLGIGVVNVNVERTEDAKEFSITFERYWGNKLNLKNRRCFTSLSSSVFSGDKELIIAHDWQYNVPQIPFDLSEQIKNHRMLIFEEFEELVKEYKKECKTLGASVPKKMELEDYNDEHIKIILRYGNK